MGIFASILAISFLIFFHELGHFIIAKIFGVRVLTFSVGFGPKILSKKYGDTTYCISAFLLGGYVKMQGELIKSDSAARGDTNSASLQNKHPFIRILILITGPLFNIILAFIIYLCVLLITGINTTKDIPIIGGVNKEFKSYEFLKPNDKILSINGIIVERFQDLPAIINTDKSKKIANITLLRDNTKLNLDVPLQEYNGRLALGISPITEQIKPNFLESIKLALINTYGGIAFIYEGLVKLLTGLIGLDNLSGIIGMTDISANAYKSDFTYFLLIVALISINLGVINLLPLPMLDGGQIIFSAYEWITKKRVDIRIANILSIMGLSLIITLMLIGAFNDISRIINRV